MSGEASRPTRFAKRNARWLRNLRENRQTNGGDSEDPAMVRQQPGVPPPSGNGHNGDGRRDEQDVEGMGGRLHFEGTLSDAERERLTADVVYWGLQQSRQGRLVSEEMLQAEFDRRLRSLELRREQPATEPSDRSDPSKAKGATSRPVVSRRNALKLIGLLGLQGATAVGTVELVDLKASQAASPASNHVAPSGVIAAGGSGPVDGSADTN